MVHKKQTFIKVIIVLVILLFVYIILAYFLSIFPFSTQHKDRNQTTSQSNSGNQSTTDKMVAEGRNDSDKVVENSSSGTQSQTSNESSKTPVQNEGKNPNQSSNITGYVSNKSVHRNSKILTVRVVIDQFLKQAGTCTLSLTKGSKTVVETAPTFNNPSSSTCQGFDISLDKLSAGKWSLKIKVETSNKTSIIDGGEVEI